MKGQNQAENHLPLGIGSGALIRRGAPDGAGSSTGSTSALCDSARAAVGAAAAKRGKGLTAAAAFDLRYHTH